MNCKEKFGKKIKSGNNSSLHGDPPQMHKCTEGEKRVFQLRLPQNNSLWIHLSLYILLVCIYIEINHLYIDIYI